MDVLQISTSDLEGGAARATYRCHQGLKQFGINSQVLVQSKLSNDPAVIADSSDFSKLITKLKLAERIDALPLKFYSQPNQGLFSLQWTPDKIAAFAKEINPDIIHLNWVCKGFLKIETLARLKRPVVWTLHDMWAFTGGCHYSEHCENYKKSCGSCPQLESHSAKDLSHWVWQRKVKAWSELNLTLVATSSWMADCARASSLFRDLRIEVIPLGLDTELYKPYNRCFAREVLNLPQDKQLVLFGALNATKDQRKGFHLLQPALHKLSKVDWKDSIELVIFGSSQPESPSDLGFKTHYLGHFSDDVSLALVYSAADVMVVPSLQEAFGQTAAEAMSCGTPVVAFNATGLKDVVEHQHTGFLAQPYEIDDLAAGIAWTLEDPKRYETLCKQSRQKARQEFALEVQSQRYIDLFDELLKTQVN